MTTPDTVDTFGMRCATNTMKQNTTIAPTMAAMDTAPEPSKSMEPASMKLLSSPMTASSTKNATSESPSSRNASRYAPHRARSDAPSPVRAGSSAGSSSTGSAPPAAFPSASPSSLATRSCRRTNQAHPAITTSSAQLRRICASPDSGDSADDTTTFSSMPSAICTTMTLGLLAANASIQNSDSMTLPAPYSTPGTSSATSEGSASTTPSSAARFPAKSRAVGSANGMVFGLILPVSANATATAAHTMTEHATTTLKKRSGTNTNGASTNANAER